MDYLGSLISHFTASVELQFTFKIIVCLIAGYIIGQERSARGKDAGVTTFTFVMIGAMLFTFLSEHIDPMSTSRIAAQIVSGIWFLGAWLIFINNNNVKNLTTAAGVWLAWAIGMAIGFDYYLIALITTIVARLVPQGNDTLSQWKKKTKSQQHTKEESDDDNEDSIQD